MHALGKFPNFEVRRNCIALVFSILPVSRQVWVNNEGGRGFKFFVQNEIQKIVDIRTDVTVVLFSIVIFPVFIRNLIRTEQLRLLLFASFGSFVFPSFYFHTTPAIS